MDYTPVTGIDPPDSTGIDSGATWLGDISDCEILPHSDDSDPPKTREKNVAREFLDAMFDLEYRPDPRAIISLYRSLNQNSDFADIWDGLQHLWKADSAPHIGSDRAWISRLFGEDHSDAHVRSYGKAVIDQIRGRYFPSVKDYKTAALFCLAQLINISFPILNAHIEDPRIRKLPRMMLSEFNRCFRDFCAVDSKDAGRMHMLSLLDPNSLPESAKQEIQKERDGFFIRYLAHNLEIEADGSFDSRPVLILAQAPPYRVQDTPRIVDMALRRANKRPIRRSQWIWSAICAAVMAGTGFLAGSTPGKIKGNTEQGFGWTVPVGAGMAGALTGYFAVGPNMGWMNNRQRRKIAIKACFGLYTNLLTEHRTPSWEVVEDFKEAGLSASDIVKLLDRAARRQRGSRH